MKLKEEEQRAVRYLETRKGCDSVSVVSYLSILSTALFSQPVSDYWLQVGGSGGEDRGNNMHWNSF